eukprot:7000823-Ditylum_brightwellii.AAC.1
MMSLSVSINQRPSLIMILSEVRNHSMMKPKYPTTRNKIVESNGAINPPNTTMGSPLSFSTVSCLNALTNCCNNRPVKTAITDEHVPYVENTLLINFSGSSILLCSKM